MVNNRLFGFDIGNVVGIRATFSSVDLNSLVGNNNTVKRKNFNIKQEELPF
jgi:hypothetical protein